jgi:hypothetical protein
MRCKTRSPTCRPDLSPSQLRSSSPTTDRTPEHLRLTTVSPIHHTMATSQSIPRFLLPRGPLLLRPQTRLLLQQHTTFLRHASTTPPKGLSAEFLKRRAAQQQKSAQIPKATPVIPQPDKYRPPSHSARKPNRNLENKIYGAPVSEEDKKRMATKKYPNMMSPEGTFSHWFFHNKSIHLWITLVRIPRPHHHFPNPNPQIIIQTDPDIDCVTRAS